jgi:uncharacterized protein
VIVDCDFRKWPDRPHWRFPAKRVAHDAFGTWLLVQPPTPYTGPSSGEWDYAFIVLVPVDEWWIASFYDEGVGEFELYVDICTPARWHTPQHVSSIDLDLDVIRKRDGTVFLADEDEFAEHQVAFGYPADVIARAREVAERVIALVESRAEPFD